VNKSTVWTIVGVIAAILIAWFLVNALFSVLAFIFKLIAVAVVAVIVFFVLRMIFSRNGSES
jgi:threonine/homoserine/homoserine lactone efflux protein